MGTATWVHDDQSTQRIQTAAVRSRSTIQIRDTDVQLLRVYATDDGPMPHGVLELVTGSGTTVQVVLSPVNLRRLADGVTDAATLVDLWNGDTGEVVA